MRPFAMVVPTIWTGETGREWRRLGADYQLVGIYLCTSPYGNQYGLFYQPLTALIEELGLTRPRAEKVLAYMGESGFAHYDLESQWVFVRNAFRIQVFPNQGTVAKSDKRILGLYRWYSQCPQNPWLGEFYDEYGMEFGLPERREGSKRPKAQRLFEDAAPPAPAAPEVEKPSSRAAEQRRLFEQWFSNYPKKKNQKAAFAEWLKIRPAVDEARLAAMIETLRWQAASNDWVKEGGRFIPSPERYLERGSYTDQPTSPVSVAQKGDDLDDWLASKAATEGE